MIVWVTISTNQDYPYDQYQLLLRMMGVLTSDTSDTIFTTKIRQVPSFQDLRRLHRRSHGTQMYIERQAVRHLEILERSYI